MKIFGRTRKPHYLNAKGWIKALENGKENRASLRGSKFLANSRPLVLATILPSNENTTPQKSVIFLHHFVRPFSNILVAKLRKSICLTASRQCIIHICGDLSRKSIYIDAKISIRINKINNVMDSWKTIFQNLPPNCRLYVPHTVL